MHLPLTPATIAAASIFALLAGGAIVLRYRSVQRFQSHPLAAMRAYPFSWAVTIGTFLLTGISILLIALALLRPQWGENTSTTRATGIDVMFTLDVSQSMRAEDVRTSQGDTNRLNLAKAMIHQYVESHPNNRYGLIIFAGEAFVSSPLTLDHTAFLTFVDGVDSQDIGDQGTNLTQAVQESLARFAIQDTEDNRGKAVVLISDGGEEAEEMSRLKQTIQKNTIPIYAIAVGTTKGAPIPERTDIFGRQQFKTYQGQVVTSKRNDSQLKQIARMSGGTFLQADSAKDLDSISSSLASLKQTALVNENGSTGWEDQYQIVLLIALISFCGAFFLHERLYVPIWNKMLRHR